MKRAIVLSIVALFAVAAGVSAQLYPGYNMIAPPVVPFDPSPTSVFPAPLDPGGMDSLIRYDAATQGYVFFDPMFPEDYGGVLLGDGAWFLSSHAGTINWPTYAGAPDGLPDSTGQMTDMWISLPKTGFTMVGHPFNHVVDAANVLFTDGTQTISWDAAAAAGWFDGGLWGYDGPTQGYFSVGTDPMMYDRTQLEPTHGYWIKTSRDNLAMIVPA